MSITVEFEIIGGNKPWVAAITGTDTKYGLARDFVNGTRDYSRANKPRTRGVMVAFPLQEGGIYEFSYSTAWTNHKRYFARIVNGAEVRMDAAEVLKAITAPAKKSAKTVMSRAWEIAREAAAKFGGKSRQYFALALKQAWAE